MVSSLVGLHYLGLLIYLHTPVRELYADVVDEDKDERRVVCSGLEEEEDENREERGLDEWGFVVLPVLLNWFSVFSN